MKSCYPLQSGLMLGHADLQQPKPATSSYNLIQAHYNEGRREIWRHGATPWLSTNNILRGGEVLSSSSTYRGGATRVSIIKISSIHETLRWHWDVGIVPVFRRLIV